jgi:hypothetical protein
MTIHEIWRRITSTRYAHALEDEITRQHAEIDRLRAENRALLNSILGIAGVPPIPASIPTSSPELPRSTHPAPTPGSEAPPSGPGTSSRGPQERLAAGGVHVTAPLRRRSWQQINRMLEFESAKKAVASDE